MEKELKTLPVDIKDFIYELYKISLAKKVDMYYKEFPKNELKNNAICIEFDISKEREYLIENAVSYLMSASIIRGYINESYNVHHGTNTDDGKYCVVITTEDNNINLVAEFIDNELKTYKREVNVYNVTMTYTVDSTCKIIASSLEEAITKAKYWIEELGNEGGEEYSELQYKSSSVRDITKEEKEKFEKSHEWSI